MKFLLLVLITISSVLCENQAIVFENEPAVNTTETNPLDKCEESICSRIYKPLCVFINGEPTTLPSRCHLAQYRCKSMKPKLKNTNDIRPALRILYDGGCYENPQRRQNSKRLRLPEGRRYKGNY